MNHKGLITEKKKKALKQPLEAYTPKFCRHHPGFLLNWRCIECGGDFCDRCVRHYHLAFAKSAACPVCKGMCKDFREEAEKIQRAQKEELTNRRNALIRNGVCLILSVPFLLEAAKWGVPFCTTDFKFLLMAAAILTIGPLRNIDLVYKCGALLYFMWLAHPMLTFALLLGHPSSKLGHIIFQTPAKYPAEALMIIVSFFLVEKVSDAFSAIYYGKKEVPTARFGVRGWALTVFSLILIITASVMGYIGGWHKASATSTYEDELAEARDLSRQFTEEMSKDSIDPVKVSRLEGEISGKIYPFKENREIDQKKVEVLNALLEPYRSLTMNEAWHYFESGKGKMHENKADIDQIKTHIFDRDFGRYKTVGEVIDGQGEFDVFAKYYLYMHLIYGRLP